jgi:hypothetical protein
LTRMCYIPLALDATVASCSWLTSRSDDTRLPFFP